MSKQNAEEIVVAEPVVVEQPLSAAIEQLCADTAAQRAYARSSNRWIRAACAAVIALAVVLAVGGFNLFSQANAAITETRVVVGDLRMATEQLAKIDFASFADELRDTVRTAGNNLTTTMTEAQVAIGKLSKIDIAALNGSIEDLKRIIAPLAALFGK